jgi:amidase
MSAAQQAVMREAVAAIAALGATIVDPADIPSIVSTDASRNLLLWPVCSGPAHARGRDGGCSTVFKYGMKRDFTAWLASLGEAAPVRSLSELRAWNHTHEPAGALRFGQGQLDISDEMDLKGDRDRFLADREKDVALAAREGLDAVLDRYGLDALLFPGPFGASIAARAGYPTVIVPFCLVPNEPTPPLPAGFEARPAPFGVSFTGRACSEPRLLELAYAFEQATRRRIPPPLD